ncbi:AMP-binding protein [Massilia sp. GCM10023247]|uniref:AMP-binding protein n=1 Tax=Massilia sp. GCM10023247 TaxID=3252643 RepID=UPI00361B33EE
MNFWNNCPGDSSLAVIDENDQHISYGVLNRRVDAAAEGLMARGSRQLGVLFMTNTLSSLVAYLACLRAGHVPLLLPDNLATDLTDSLISRYQPNWVMGASVGGEPLPGSGLLISCRTSGRATELAPGLALLLSTSGSTGSPKLVRLSYEALQENASSIAGYLGIGASDRALTVLPPYYSYGLSVINSHLTCRAVLVLRDVSVMSPDFVSVIRRHEVSSIAGVPYVYQMLYRTGFHNQDLPSLRTLTQAGGRLDDRLTQAFGKIALERSWKFFVMYGQTEATARISYVPPERLLEKVGSIGVAIPNGQLMLDPGSGEIVYHGPNVMMGYALERADLALADELGGILRTGDLGRQDDEGFFYVTGRLKRFVKLAGNRIGLDEVEALLQKELQIPVSVGGRDERLIICLETEDPALPDTAKQLVATRYGIHHSLCRLRTVERLPLLPTGKKDYTALMADA